MLAWLSENLATVIICAALITVIAAIVIRLILNKKRADLPADAVAITVRWEAAAIRTRRETGNRRGKRQKAGIYNRTSQMICIHFTHLFVRLF